MGEPIGSDEFPACANPDRCDFWRDFAAGPWTCEACHPRPGQGRKPLSKRPNLMREES
jgi:hypothetical protein